MKIDVVTRYECKWRLPRKVNFNSTWAYAPVPLEIAEAEPGSATLAHRVCQEYSTDDRHPTRLIDANERVFATPSGDPVDVYDWRGSLWVQRAPVDEFAVLAAAEGGDNPFCVHAEDGEGHLMIGPDPLDSHQSSATEEELVKEHGKLRDFTVHLDRAAAMMAVRAEQFAVIDGWVCERIREPVIGVVMWPGADRVSVVVGEVDGEHGPISHRRMKTESSLGSRFGIDQMAAARSFAAELAAEHGIPAVQYARVEQASEWAVRFRGEAETLRAAAVEVVERMSRVLGHLDEHLGLAVHDLAQATLRTPGMSPSILEAALRVDAQREVLESAPQGRHGPYLVEEERGPRHGERFGDLAVTMTRLANAVTLWHRRESLGIEWVDAGLSADATYSGGDCAYELTTLMAADAAGDSLGIDLSEQAAEAARGAGHLIAVENGGEVAAVAFARTSSSGPEIAAVFTRHGARPQRRIVDVATEHVSRGFVPEEVDELGMAGL